MKAKNLLGAMFMAGFGAIIALFVYTRYIENDKVIEVKGVGPEAIKEGAPVLANFEPAPQQVDMTYAAEMTVHAVVHVKTTSSVGAQMNNPILEFFYGDAGRREPQKVTGYGSGVIISNDGYIITNNHVIEDAEEVDVRLNDNREFKAQVIGRDPNTDLAVVKIKATGLPSVKYGNSDDLKLGEWVLAVGNPFNLTSTVTAGIVSAKARNLGIIETASAIESFIQTDAALNRGNSGGALVNTKGELVGITSAIYSPSGAYAGNSFAIPANLVKKVVADLIEFGEVQRALLGVRISDVTTSLVEKENLKVNDIRGVYIAEIIDNGAAADAGLKKGDIVTRINNAQVNSVSELMEQVGKFRPGEKANVVYLRDGRENSVGVTFKNSDNNTKIIRAGEGGGIIFGAKIEPLSQDDMKTYKVDYGVKVTEINDGRFRDLGIKKGYIILTVNGKKIKTAADLRNASDNGVTINALEGIQANGTYFTYQFRR